MNEETIVSAMTNTELKISDGQQDPKSVGTRVLRVEDDRLLRGAGQFADDVDLRGQLWMRVVRSSVAHGRIVSIDIRAAQSLPGVHAVFIGEDLEDLSTIPLEQIGYHDVFPDLDEYGHPVLATDKVNYVGQPVAAVFAEDQYVAEDGAELVLIEYEPLPVILDPRIALEEDAPQLVDGHSNEAASFERAYGDLDQAFADADYVIETEFRVGRHSGVSMEGRSTIADYDSGHDRLTVWGPVHTHDNRDILAAMLEMPLTSIRMRQCDIGGNFGSRGGVFPEGVLVPFAARKLERPIKWVEDRTENLVGSGHAREQIHKLQGAFTADGVLLGLRDEIWHNKGGYLRQAAPLLTDITVGMVCGPYRVPAYCGICRAVLTNKTPLSAYRAPGRYECTVARERLLDLAADRVGIDPVEIRRRNLLTETDLPWKPGMEMVGEEFLFDSGDVLKHFNRALDEADYTSWQSEAEELRSQGRAVGTGIGVLMDKAGLGLYETSEVEVDSTGRVRVLTGGSSVGQGIETVLAQIVADELTVSPHDIQVFHGDTDLIPDGVGSWSSRSTVIAGGAARNAARKVVEKAKRIAGRLMEVDFDDLVLKNGQIRVAGAPNRSMSLGEIAAAWDGWTARLAGDEPGLGAKDIYRETHMNYPYGVTAVQIEIDSKTGTHQLRRFFTSCEAGRVINPQTTAGQVIGAAAQGIGGALFEEFTYDEYGQPLATSFIEYLIPTANEVPPMDLYVSEDAPTPDNPFGAKGIGEVGLIAVGAAVAGAVADAVGDAHAVNSLPLSPAILHQLVGHVRPGEQFTQPEVS